MRRVFAVLAALPLIAAAAPDVGDGYLSGPALPGFTVGYSSGNAHEWIMEQVPDGETVQHWTRMVTTQRFTALPASPAEFLSTLAKSLPQSCPGARASTPESATVSGRPAARMRADCPENPQTHQPETFEILAIAGPSDMHVKQVAFRYVPAPEDLEWADRFLDAVTFCLPMSREPACRIVQAD